MRSELTGRFLSSATARSHASVGDARQSRRLRPSDDVTFCFRYISPDILIGRMIGARNRIQGKIASAASGKRTCRARGTWVERGNDLLHLIRSTDGTIEKQGKEIVR